MAELIAALTTAGVPTFFLVPTALLVYLIVQRGNRRDDPYVAAVEKMNGHLNEVKNTIVQSSTDIAVLKEQINGINHRVAFIESHYRNNGKA